MKGLTIVISGEMKSGKTTMARSIEDFLLSFGFENVTVIDDGNLINKDKLYDSMTDHLRRCHADPIVIKTVQICKGE